MVVVVVVVVVVVDSTYLKRPPIREALSRVITSCHWVMDHHYMTCTDVLTRKNKTSIYQCRNN